MINNPLFSVIIPTYNHGRLLNKCINSIVNQTFKNWEAIVINNYSTDNTIEIIEAYKDDRIKIINFRNKGIIAASRNIGIKNATGDWVCFLDSDDWWYPGKLEETLKFIDNTDIIYHDLDIYKNGKKVLFRKVKGRAIKGNVIKDLLINSNALPNTSVTIRKSIIDKVGYLSEDKELIAVEDADYWLRVASVTERFRYIPKSLGGYYVGDNISVSEKHIEREIALYNTHKFQLTSPKERFLAEKHLNFRIARIYHKLNLSSKAFFYYKSTVTFYKPKISMKAIMLLFCLVAAKIKFVKKFFCV